MRARRAVIACCLSGVLGIAGAAQAQVGARRPVPPRRLGEPRVTLGIRGGVQSPAGTLSDHITFDRDVETETIDVTYPRNAGVLVDVGIGVRLWKRLGIGFAVGHVAGDGTAEVTARVPHPFFFTQPRTVTGRQAGVAREETDLHLQVQYAILASRRARVVLGAGPSRIKLTEDVVTDVNVTETYPYDTAAFRDAATKGSTASVNGFNAGLDVRWKLTRSVGFGGLVRYTRANAELDVRAGHTLSMKAGGAQAAAGIRFAF
jgi:hypothetical protein